MREIYPFGTCKVSNINPLKLCTIIPTSYQLIIITFQFDHFISNFAHVDVIIMVDAAAVMIVRELLNKLRFVVGLMVVGLNGFTRAAQLLPTRVVITTTYINYTLFNFQPFKLCVLIEIFVRLQSFQTSWKIEN